MTSQLALHVISVANSHTVVDLLCWSNLDQSVAIAYHHCCKFSYCCWFVVMLKQFWPVRCDCTWINLLLSNRCYSKVPSNCWSIVVVKTFRHKHRHPELNLCIDSLQQSKQWQKQSETAHLWAVLLCNCYCLYWCSLLISYIQFCTAMSHAPISTVSNVQDLQCHVCISESVRAVCNGGSRCSYRRTHLAQLGSAGKAERSLRTCQEVSQAAITLP